MLANSLSKVATTFYTHGFIPVFWGIDKVSEEDYTQVPTCKTASKNNIKPEREDVVGERALEPLNNMTLADFLLKKVS